MKKAIGLLLAAWIFAPAGQAAITYVDATHGAGANTQVYNGGSPTEWNPQPQTVNTADNLWKIRETFANGGIAYESNANGSEDAPGLVTTITGLNPGSTYKVYAYFWSADGGNNWRLKASATTPPPLADDPLVSFSRLGSGTSTQAVEVPDDNADTFGDTFDGSVMAREGNRLIYECVLGLAAADGSGNIGLYIDDQIGVNRTWYDGVGYEEVGASVAPSILSHPQSQSLILGQTNVTLTLSTQVEGSLPLQYQWWLDGSPVPGATEISLVISNTTAADAGSYAVTVSNAFGTATSDAAAFTVVTAPVQPAAQVAVEGGTTTFQIEMPEDLAYTYQWAKDSVDLPGATGTALVLPVVQAADAGLYTVAVTLGADSATSDPAELVVAPAPTGSYADAVLSNNPIAYWRLGESAGAFTAVDEQAAFDGSYSNSVALGGSGAILGDPNTAAGFPGDLQSKVEVAYSLDDVAVINPSVFSVELWAMVTGGSGFRSPATSRDFIAADWILGWTFYATDVNTWQFRTGLGEGPLGESAWNTINGPSVENNAWAHLVGTYDGTDMAFYVNGVQAGVLTNVTYAPQDDFGGWPIYLGAGATETVGQFFFVGNIDEVAIYDTALSPSDVLAHYAGGLDPSAPPVISAHPQSQPVLIGDPVTLEVGAVSSSLVTYQWQKDGVDLPGETNQTLVIADMQIDAGGAYRAVVSNVGGSATSDSADLVPAPNYIGTFVLPDDSNTVLVRDGSTPWSDDDNATANANAWWQSRSVFAIDSGISPHAYQANGSSVANGDVAVRTTITGLTPGENYAVWVLFGTQVGNATARDVLAGFEGADPLTRFTVASSSDTGETSVGGNWDVRNAFLGVVSADGTGEIAVEVNYAGTERTVYHGLGYQLAVPVPEPPVILGQPKQDSVALGESAALSVNIASLLPLTHQWRFNGEDIPNRTNATLEIASMQASDAGFYDVVGVNSAGSVTSTVAELVAVSDYLGTFVFPDETNTVLTRDGSPTWFDATDQATADDGSLWWQRGVFAISGVSTAGYQTTQSSESVGDVEVRTTLSGLTPGESYAVWLLFSWVDTMGEISRIGGAFDGEETVTISIETSPDTGIDSATSWSVLHGYLGTRVADGSGQIKVLADFRGLNRCVYNGVGYQTARLAMPATMGIELQLGQVVISWDDASGVLQSTEDLGSEVWTDVPDAASPFSVSTPVAVESFRVREP